MPKAAMKQARPSASVRMFAPVVNGVLAHRIDTASGARFVITLEVDHSLDHLDLALIRLLAANLAVGFEAVVQRGEG